MSRAETATAECHSTAAETSAVKPTAATETATATETPATATVAAANFNGQAFAGVFRSRRRGGTCQRKRFGASV
jgi:hypothetical protein